MNVDDGNCVFYRFNCYINKQIANLEGKGTVLKLNQLQLNLFILIRQFNYKLRDAKLTCFYQKI